MAKCATLDDLNITTKHRVRIVGDRGIYLRGNNMFLDRSTPIYRYIKQSSLCKMLTDGVLHVPNIQSFTDIREKRGISKIIESTNDNVLSTIDGKDAKSWPLSLKFHEVPNIKTFRRKERIRKGALVCASCWTLDKRSDNSQKENYLMWKSYGGNEVSCRISSTIGKLIDSIQNTRNDIVIENMVYGNAQVGNEYENNIFHKTIHYEDEQEIRMVVLSTNPNGVNLKVNVSSLIQEIKVSPFVSRCVADESVLLIKSFCMKYPKINVDYSEIKEYPYVCSLNDTERRIKGERI